MKITIAKENSQYNITAPKDYYDYNSYEITPGNIDLYEITSVLGKGKYSEVFRGRIIDSEYLNNKVVIKVLKPIKKSKVCREILILKNLNPMEIFDQKSNDIINNYCEYIINLKDVVYDKLSKTYSLIFPYIDHIDSYTTFTNCNIYEAIEYSKQILKALEYCHSKGIMHRDIKPGNILMCKNNECIDNTNIKDNNTNNININKNKYSIKIIDWGLAEFYHPKADYSVRVASKYYKAPELIVEYPYYDYSIDIWSFGCILAEMITKRQPFFYKKDKSIKNSDLNSNILNKSIANQNILNEIVSILGYEDLQKYLNKYGIFLSSNIEDSLNKYLAQSLNKNKNFNLRTDLRKYIPEYFYEQNNELVLQLVDILDKIFVYDHNERPTASELLAHPIFNKKFY